MDNEHAKEQTRQQEDDQNTKMKKGVLSRLLPFIIGIVIIVVIIGAGIYMAYQAGLDTRIAGEEDAKISAASEQYALGIVDLEEGRCNMALQRFEYIIDYVDAEYPGIVDKMTQAILCMNATATATPYHSPTPTQTPTMTPTPDMRAAEDILSDVEEKLSAEEYDQALALLDSIRQQYPDFQPVVVDGFYYQVYRERGEYKILIMGELEAGIFDLNRAEKFGPLDAIADNYRNWASWYLIGLSFWDLDWDEVYYYFTMLVQSAPNLTLREEYGDEVYFITAQARLEEAKIEYAPVLKERAYALFGEKEFCDAYEAMRLSNDFVPFEDPQEIDDLGRFWGKCEDSKEE